MKKTLLITALFIGVIRSVVTAQTAEPVQAKISYLFTHVQDTTKRDKPHQEEMVLLLGKNASVYASMDKILQDEMRKKEIAEQMKTANNGNFNFQLKTPSKGITRTEYYQFANEKKLFLKQHLVNNYLIEEALPAIDWKISPDTASYGGLKCQKATAHFKGRDYIAWFCSEIPFQSGPWKLNGLPGLILEAYDTKKEVVFKFNGFETIKNDPSALQHVTVTTPQPKPEGESRTVIVGLEEVNILHTGMIALPKDAIKTTQKEYDKLNEAMIKDPAGFVNSSLAGAGIVVREGKTSVKTVVNKNQINNPIELPEK